MVLFIEYEDRVELTRVFVSATGIWINMELLDLFARFKCNVNR